MKFIWIELAAVKAIHKRQIAEHGGSDGIRDEGLLSSAMARPQNTFAYAERADIADLAAAYAFGIAQNHPFIDGNKRTAYVVMRTSLRLNKFDIKATPEDKYLIVLHLAEGRVDELDLAEWIRDHLLGLDPE